MIYRTLNIIPNIEISPKQISDMTTESAVVKV